ncbi:MAG: prolyl oligopeptidase family serine peptidase [Ginsengibacter sp.]
MKKRNLIFTLFVGLLLTINSNAQSSFSLKEITSYPFPAELTSLPNGSKIALSINQQGKRNIYVGEGPELNLRKLTNYNNDEGQEITSVRISEDGKWVVYVRGSDHGAFDESIPRNPSSSIEAPEIQVYCIPFAGGNSILLGEGDFPVIQPDSKQVTFIKNHQVWVVPIDGSKPAKNLFYAKGRIGSLEWSPDGSQLLFASSRGDHSFIGIYTKGQPSLQWIAPTFARDQDPQWSPDGKKIVFIRRPASGGAPDSMTVDHHSDWAIWTADIDKVKAQQIWEAPKTLQGSVPESNGRYNLHWAANNRIVFLSYQDGWPHLYSISALGGEPLLLTPGNFNVEQIRLSPDKKSLVFATNTGPDKDDLDRRHIAKVSVDEANMQMLTSGDGLESTPEFIDNGSSIVLLSATTQRPTLPAVMTFAPGKFRITGQSLIPTDFPASKLVTPKSVTFKAADGHPVYGQLFEPLNGPKVKPAVLFVHGGPERQMLLGWHYMDYYANTYAINQYLVSRGFVVLSVNYRLGIGYGYDFQNPKNSGMNGASEYKDIKAAGEWMTSQQGIDAKRIGIYGGSYGGYLTAMALARDSKIFAAGVDISGMHNLLFDLREYKNDQPPDYELAKKLTWESSPDAYLNTWTSPVLIISGDDDGNVPFFQSVDLIRRFQEKGFLFESLAVPDETHHWMKYSHILKMDSATADFLERKLGMKDDPTSLRGKIICIDPGHGGTASTDHYRVGLGGEREEWINLRVAQLLKKKLEEKGAKVIMTRTGDVSVPLDERAKIARENKADVFISIHHNATADTSVNFPIIYFHGAASENLAGIALGRDVASCLEKYFYKKEIPESLNSDYTIFPSNGAAVLRNTYGIPAVLGEASFFTNPSEETRLKREDYNSQEAMAYLKALELFFHNPVLVIKPMEIPQTIVPFKVFEEADRMNQTALDWKKDFMDGEKLMNSKDTNDLRKALNLFTLSAKSFPDSYVARACHLNMAELLEKLNEPEKAKEERKRVQQFYVNLN